MNNILAILILFFFFTSCRKKETIPSNNIEIEYDNRDQFIGYYKVYDTIGNYLYDFQVEKKEGPVGDECSWSYECDSLLITNYANKFDFSIIHQRYFEGNYLDIRIHHPILDYEGYSWHLSSKGGTDTDSFNQLNNDTIVLYYQMSNIAFYLYDVVPYYSCNCKQIAVKQ